jgi:alpha-N-acetylglucosaminidase
LNGSEFIMRATGFLGRALLALATVASASVPSTAGIDSLVRRRLPHHVDAFEFSIETDETSSNPKDSYKVFSTKNGKVHVQGTTVSAVLSG